METNLSGAFYCSKEALARFKIRGGGYIINIGSLAGKNAFAGGAAYNASKFGALGFTHALREDLRKRGIRVLALLPGATSTDIWSQFWPGAPREKMISAEAVAQAVLHAVSAPANTAIEEIRIGPASGVL